jgi:hypothetical protein
VITTTMRLPAAPGAANDGHRNRHPTGNDNSAPITITNETFQRQPQPSVLAPVAPLAPMTSNPAGAAPGPVTPMMTNPAGAPPGPVAPLPTAPRVDPATPVPRNPDGQAWGGRNWHNRAGDPRNVQALPPAAQQTVPQQAQPATIGVRGAGRVQIPTVPTTNTIAAPPQLQQPVVTPPQIPTAVSPVAPAIPSQPVHQPMAPGAQPPAAQSPHGRPIFIPGVGNVPANIGRGNLGQGNVGSPGQ